MTPHPVPHPLQGPRGERDITLVRREGGDQKPKLHAVAAPAAEDQTPVVPDAFAPRCSASDITAGSSPKR